MKLPHALAAFQFPNFARFMSAKFLATFAIQMQSVAVGWQVYSITKDPLDLGLIGLSQFLPFVLLVLPAGHAADRFDRQKILTLCYVTELACGMLFLWFTLSGLAVVWPVFAVMVVFGMARAFSAPSSQALIANLVPIDSFANATALNASAFQVATIAGPTLGGLLYLAGPQVVYSCVVLFLAVSVFLMAGIKTLTLTPRGTEPASWHTVLEGLRFVKSRPVVLGAISLDLFAVLFGGAVAMLPIYAGEVLHVGPAGLGVLRTAPGAGAALTAAVLTFAPISRHVGRWMFGGVFVFGVSTVVFGLSTTFALSVCALFLLGAGDMVSVYIRHILIQLETPDAIRGRVSAVNAVFIGASNELGEFESGVTAKWLGLVRSVVIGGVATLVVTGMWMRLFPALRDIDRFPGASR